jgi:DNA-binding winged helix-turn-helix (wHTH) protein/tetratricopeptide (TPR) repeat protein
MWLFPPFRLDLVNQCLWRGDSKVSLMPKPFAVLKYLVEHAGRLVTQDELIEAIWPDTHVQPEVLRRYILEIRRVLGDQAGKSRFIETLTKRGYRFIASVTADRASGPAPPTTLVGRADPLADLDRYLKNALRGKRQICFISGEAGIGKSTLVDAFQFCVSSNPAVQVMRGQCVEGFGGKEPYYPLLEALGRLIREPGKASLLDALTGMAPTWALQFPSLLPPDDHAALRHEALGATRERMVRELCEALEVITREKALLLILEDVHWADHSTLDVLSVVARRRDPAQLLVLGTVRPVDLILSESPLKTLKQDLLSHRLCHELALRGLQQADVAAYLTAEFAGDSSSADLAALIHRRSEGNPLFMTAILDHLVQTGTLAQTNGNWKVTAPVDELGPGVPETLKQMLDLQLARLSSDELHLLKCASVAGEHFTVCSLAIMLESTEQVIEPKCVALAEQQQFLKSCGTCELPNGVFTIEYEFRHSLYREALYGRLSVTQRVSLHRSLAEGLVSYESAEVPVLTSKIAAHFEEGRQYGPAIRRFIMAAQIASRRYAHRESMDVLEHARGLLPKVEPARRPRLEWEILERIADAHYTLGEMAQSIARYDSLAARAAEDGENAGEARVLMSLSHPASFVDPDRSIAACERAAQVAAAAGDPIVAAQANLLVACWRVLINGSSKEDASACELAATSLRELGGEMPAYGRLLYARAMLYQSEYTKAIENADQAVRELTGGDSVWSAPSALHAKASALGYLGRLGETHEVLVKGFDLVKKDNNAEWLGVLQYTLFWLRWHTFDVAGMRELSNAVTDSGMSGLSQQMQIQLIVTQGFAALAAGEYERATRYFEEIHDRRHPKSMLFWRAEMLARHGLGETRLALDDLKTARAEADAFTASAGSSRDLYLAAIAWEFSARVALAAGEHPLAQQHILLALETVGKVELRLAAWRVHATAWDVYRKSNRAKAEAQRERAEAVIHQIAESLDRVDPLRQSFLSAKQIQRVLEAGSTAAIASASRGTSRIRSVEDRRP